MTTLTMNIELKDLSKGPVYPQVREQIETQISNKTVASGESLPSPAALAQKLSVDKGEIQRAYFELEQSGLINQRDRQRLPRPARRQPTASREPTSCSSVSSYAYDADPDSASSSCDP